MKYNSNLNDIARHFVEFGKKAGADEVQISIYEGNDFSVSVRDGNIEELNEASDKAASVKVIVDKKVASASSGDLAASTMEKLIKNAIERAEYSGKDEFAGIPNKTADYPSDMSKYDLYDEAILKMSPEEKIKRALDMERFALADKRIRASGGAGFGTGEGTRVIANSNGILGQYSTTSISASVSLQAGKGDDFQEDYWWESSHHLNKLPSGESIAKKAIERVTRLVGAKKVETQVVPIVFDPQMSQMLFGFLLQCISGSAIYMKQSFLVDKINQSIASKMLNIIDDPTIPGGAGSRPFDGEGVPMSKMAIVENGVLKNYLLDTYSAKKLGMKSNGHASGISNCYIAPGNVSPEEIIKSVKKGLYLTNTIGQGTVPTSGDISKGAYGLWIENGKLTYPVAEVTFTGTLSEMLNNIDMIGNDLNMRSSLSAPTIKINNMSISGK